MKRLSLTLALLAIFFRFASTHAAVVAPAAIARSENGLFSADITSTAPNEIIVAVHRHDDAVKIFSWSKKVPWNGANATFTSFPWIKRFISNDGESVVLQNQQYRMESWVWVGKGALPIRYYLSDFDRVLGEKTRLGNIGSPYVSHSELLQFVSDAQGVFALWFPLLDKWVTIDLKTGQLDTPTGSVAEALTTIPLNAPRAEVWLRPPSEDGTRLLNEEGTRRCLEAVRKHQPSAIQTMLRPLEEKLSAFIPSLQKPVVSRAASLSESYAAYLFLARHKVPAAKRYLRKLLEMPIEDRIVHTMFGTIPQYSVFSHERILGDFAWRLWNNLETKPSMRLDYLSSVRINNLESEYFGQVAGFVRLPIVRPDTRPGAVWVFLIPARISDGEWIKSRDVVTLYCQLDFTGIPMGAQPQFDSLSYYFGTLSPGEYKLKALWDRRPPFAARDGFALPGPGDYESLQSEVISIKAGGTLGGPDLDCTNRVGQAENYYAADDRWKELNPEPKGNRMYTSRYWSSSIGGIIGTAPPLAFRNFNEKQPHSWKISAKTESRNLVFRKAESIQVLPIGDPLERDELMLTFRVANLRDNALRKLVPKVRDEHGCSFAANLFVPTPRDGAGELTIRVPVFPRNKEFTLSLHSAIDDKLFCSYTIRNGGPSQMAQWHARRPPLSRTLGGKSILLTSLNRSEGAHFQIGEENTGSNWTPEAVIYHDREGNRSYRADEFCREEKSVRVQIIHESQTREFIAEFADKR